MKTLLLSTNTTAFLAIDLTPNPILCRRRHLQTVYWPFMASFLLFSLLPFVLAAPTAIPNPADLQPGSGSLYPDPALINPQQTIATTPVGSGAIVTNYPLVPGQDAAAKDGVYLNFEGIDNFQPLRGGTGATDPGQSFTISCIDQD